MRSKILFAALLFCALVAVAQTPSVSELQQRRQRAAALFHDGILLVHATSTLSWPLDSFRQDPFFYYFTGLENTSGAILAIDGTTGESWVFVPEKLRSAMGMPPEVTPAAASSLGFEHVVARSQLENFLSSRAGKPQSLYYVSDHYSSGELPSGLQPESKSGPIPLWIVTIAEKWPNLHPVDAFDQVHTLSEVESATELEATRKAANATVKAFMSGLAAIKPGVSQRSAESVVESACWDAGAHGSSFWPWAMTGKNAVFPRPFWSLSRYDHLDGTFRSGDLVRLDVGCEWAHYGGDLGRTVPASGKYTPEQREIWNVLVAAYRAAATTFRDGTTEEQAFSAWRGELLRQRQSAKNDLTRSAIDLWVDRKNDPFWELHTTNVDAGSASGGLHTGMVIDFEPIVSIGDLGFYLEDMFLITKDGAEDLTPGVPFTADEIEAAMRKTRH